METQSNNQVGKISLWAAFGGLLGGTAVALLFVLVEVLTGGDMPFSLCVLMFIGIEVGALITGIAGWGSPHGKAGFGLSVALLTLITYFIPVSRRVETNKSAEIEPVMVIERTQSAAMDKQ